MKSTLSPKALELSELELETEIARVRYHNGQLTSLVRKTYLSCLTIKAINLANKTIQAMDHRGELRTYSAAELGLVPYADGKMSEEWCVLLWHDALELMYEYIRDHS